MNRARRPRWSLVVMRGADKSVKQFHVSKRSVVAAPAAAILAVTGCIAGLQIKSTYELHDLEEQLSQQSIQFSHTISGKDEAILSLQQELVRLSRQAQEMQTQVNDLEGLESKLKLFIDKYGSIVSPTHTNSPSSTSKRDVHTLSAASSSTSSQEMKLMAVLASNSSLDLQALGSMVDTMEQTMEQSLKQAQARQAELDAIPSGWPTASQTMTSSFGYRKDPFTGRATFHAGIDISGKSGDPVFSAADGKVSESGYSSSEGNYIVIDHDNGLQSVYMHLQHNEAQEGETVARGEKIGLLGSSGRSTGPHLHFQVMQKHEAVNPLDYLQVD
ncbi:MAG: M23 family metallopeptidase [Candidatus Pristimantibacillus sp.]